MAARAERRRPRASWSRHCASATAARVQCLVLVRDDFWMAATRFMGELEVPLVEGHNSAAVDLFPGSPRREGARGVRASLWCAA